MPRRTKRFSFFCAAALPQSHTPMSKSVRISLLVITSFLFNRKYNTTFQLQRIGMGGEVRRLTGGRVISGKNRSASDGYGPLQQDAGNQAQRYSVRRERGIEQLLKNSVRCYARANVYSKPSFSMASNSSLLTNTHLLEEARVSRSLFWKSISSIRSRCLPLC